MKNFVVVVLALTLATSASAQTTPGTQGGSPGTSAGQDGASNGTTGTISGEGSTTGMQGTTGANVSGSIHSQQGTGSTAGTSPGGPNLGTSRPPK